jgi:HSP20 family molecular chaperone IbpA
MIRLGRCSVRFKRLEDFSQRTPFARFSSDALSPKIDIAESKTAIDVTAELPGVDEKDLDVTLANGMLTIRDRARRAGQG